MLAAPCQFTEFYVLNNIIVFLNSIKSIHNNYLIINSFTRPFLTHNKNKNIMNVKKSCLLLHIIFNFTARIEIIMYPPSLRFRKGLKINHQIFLTNQEITS